MHSISEFRPTACSSSASCHQTIVVIDDNPAVTAEVSRILSASGYEVTCCHTRDEAFLSIRQFTPNLVIADTNLEGHSGLDLCHQLRLEADMSDVPCMFLSGAQTPDIIRRSDESGGAYHLRKPFDPDVLLELVRKVMRLTESAREKSAALA